MFSLKVDFHCALIFVLFIGVHYSAAFDLENDLVFRLYTREEPNTYYAMKAMFNPPPAFNPNRPTRIFIHGFKSSEKVLIRYKNAYLKLGNYNFIAVDWINGANTVNYLKAKGRIQPVSHIIFVLIHFVLRMFVFSEFFNFFFFFRFPQNWLN